MTQRPGVGAGNRARETSARLRDGRRRDGRAQDRRRRPGSPLVHGDRDQNGLFRPPGRSSHVPVPIGRVMGWLIRPVRFRRNGPSRPDERTARRRTSSTTGRSCEFLSSFRQKATLLIWRFARRRRSSASRSRATCGAARARRESIVRGMRTPGGWSVCNDREPCYEPSPFCGRPSLVGQPSLCAGDGLEPGAVAVDDRGGVRGAGERPERQTAITPEP
jgi:hypothetical protein